MIKAAIFDMDGVLIDSEPLWQEAEKKVFATVGIHLTTEMCFETMGMRTDEVVAYRYKKQKWHSKSQEEVADEIMDELEELIRQKGRAMPGVSHIFEFFKKRNVRLALASSSHMRVINTALKKLTLTDVFEIIHSGEFEKNGKPHPAIYVSTLKKLNLHVDEAIAFEDSYNGLIAAKSAGLPTVAIPEQSVWHESKFDIAFLKLKSLKQFSEQHFQTLTRQNTPI